MEFESTSRSPMRENGISQNLSEKSNGFDIVGKFKVNNNGQNVPRSPLALMNSESSGLVLVKRNRNVPTTTVSTQTDKSYLLTMKTQN